MIKQSYTILIVFFLLIGVLYKLSMTDNGKFIFNMDNARDFVDVREMVIIHKLRLIGNTSAIEGLYYGPGWYYLLSIPFLLTNGNPYGGILLVILLWVIGGFFLLKICSRFGLLPFLSIGLLWIFSNYTTLATIYSYNPNPVILLMPLFIYLVEKYLLTGQLLYSLFLWFLAGFFTNCELNFGFFLPFIIIGAICLSKHAVYFKTKTFLFGLLAYFSTLLPQLLFDIKHQFIMSRSVIRFLQTPAQNQSKIFSSGHFNNVIGQFQNVIVGTFGNSQILAKSLLILALLTLITTIVRKFRPSKKSPDKELTPLIIINSLLALVPFIFYIFIPAPLNSWHIGGIVPVAILCTGIIMKKLSYQNLSGKIIVFALFLLVIQISFNNFSDFLLGRGKSSSDPAVFQNEIAAVDFVYQKAGGKNFKAYVYLPSVIDYPYQYIFWWRGITKYGYIPEDYAYLPNQPDYISNKKLLKSPSNPPSNGLIFLIKEPDRNNLRHLWENSFKNLPLIQSEQIGPLIIEIRQDRPSVAFAV